MTIPTKHRGAMGLGAGLIAGWLAAAIFSFALGHADSPMVAFAYAAPIPLFFTGLAAGAVSALVAGLSGIAGLAFAVSPQTALSFALIYAVPATLLCVLALRHKTGSDGKVFWYPEGRLSTALVLYPALVVVASYFAAAHYEGGLLGATTTVIQKAFDSLAEGVDPEDVIKMKAMAPSMAYLVPGVVGLCWCFLMMMCAVFAQHLIKKDQWLLRAPFTVKGYAFPSWIVGLVAVAGLAGYFAPEPYAYLGANLCILFCLPLFIAGLAVVHAFAETRKRKRPLLTLFYVFISLAPQLVILVALLGVLDTAFSLQSRLPQAPKQV